MVYLLLAMDIQDASILKSENEMSKEENKEELERIEAQKKLEQQWSDDIKTRVEEFKATLKQVETYGLSDEDRAAMSADTGRWPPQIQLLVSAYIKHLRFTNSVMHQSLEMIASGMIEAGDAAEFAQGALEQVGLRDWRNIPHDESNTEES